MSPSIWVLTSVAWSVPVLLTVVSIALPEARGMLWIAGFVTLVYASVWLWWRPTAFDVAGSELRLCFPLRERVIPRQDLSRVRQLDRRQLRELLGFAVRIGAGGLWGGFGWLWTQKLGLVEFYISRTDGLVLLERGAGRPLLISPLDPAGFEHALGIGE